MASAPKADAAREDPKEREPVRRAPPPTRAQPRSDALEDIVFDDEPQAAAETSDETVTEDEQGLEERVDRVRIDDLDRMRELAEKVYYEGWSHLSVDEQLAFMYRSRSLEYVAPADMQRPEVRSTVYRVLGAQGKSLGMERHYRAEQLSRLSEQFFERVLTPINAPELYRRVANTSYFIDQDRR